MIHKYLNEIITILKIVLLMLKYLYDYQQFLVVNFITEFKFIKLSKLE